MREVSVSRFVRAPPATVERALTPERLVGYEGSFTVSNVDAEGDETLVTVGARGLELTLRFDTDGDDLHYTQDGDRGPFSSMETWVRVAPENEGTRVTIRSSVSLGLPVPALTDRIAAWKRHGELERALDALAADV